jgi:hypothetical protein
VGLTVTTTYNPENFHDNEHTIHRGLLAKNLNSTEISV